MTTPDDYVLALAEERAGYLRWSKGDRVIPVDDELLRLGWCVDSDGVLVEMDTVTHSRKTPATPKVVEIEPVFETAEAEPAPEKAVPPRPRGRRKTED